MGKSVEQWMVVDAEVRVPAAITQLVQFSVADPTDLRMMERKGYWLDMSLTPRSRNAQLCYRDRWARSRFEPIGKVYLLPPDADVQIRTQGGTEHQSLLCHLDPASVERWLGGDLGLSERQLEASLDITDARVRALLVRLSEEMRNPGFANTLFVELLVGMLTIELRRCFDRFDRISPAGALAPWRLRRIDERLAENVDAPCLAELATLCDLSERQLARGFRASRGCSLGAYVANHRIERAKVLLSASEDIKGVAARLGFSSSSAFCFAFRRATGMTPGEFRGIDLRTPARPTTRS